MPALVLGAASRAASGHGEGPPPPPTPPPPPPVVDIEKVYPARWSWVHWWEANRDVYLQMLRQGRGQQVEPNAVARFRSLATESLLKALKDEAWQVRMWAAVALGQMREGKALAALADLAKSDSQEPVVRASLMAIGLLDCPESEKFLVATALPDGPPRQTALCALGLIGTISPDSIVGLHKTLEGGDPAMAAISAWALCRRVDPANVKFLSEVLSRTSSAWLASEAILCLGHQGRPESAGPLAEVLLATPAGRNFPAWKDLEDRHQKVLLLYHTYTAKKTQYDKAYDQYVKDYQDWRAKQTPNAPGPQDRDPGVPMRLQIGLEKVYQARLRASAAIALGKIDAPRSRQALLKCLEGDEDGYDLVYKGFAIMSLGQLGEPACVPVLTQMLNRAGPGGGRKPSEALKSPLRGFAAVALGLYARPVSTPQGPQDRPNYDKVCLALAERAADRAEELEVRAASTVALGLSGRTENLRYLQAVSKLLGDGEELLTGYMLLARGMLGDRNIMEAGKRFLAVGRDNQETSGLLARRAAVLGLALAGSQEAIPILMDAWNLSYHANREVTLALALCEAYNATDPLVKLLKESANPWERAFAARSLGDLFVGQRPQRLAWLISGTNYTLKNTRLMPCQAMANEFLYLHLLPLFGDQWR